jgi:hypothetical protein
MKATRRFRLKKRARTYKKTRTHKKVRSTRKTRSNKRYRKRKTMRGGDECEALQNQLNACRRHNKPTDAPPPMPSRNLRFVPSPSPTPPPRSSQWNPFASPRASRPSKEESLYEEPVALSREEEEESDS